MSKRAEPDEGFGFTEEQVKKAMKLLESEVSLDFLNILANTEIYAQILLQLDWRQLQALRVVSSSHRHWVAAHGTDHFWRSVFMADIVDNSSDPKITQNLADEIFQKINEAIKEANARTPVTDEESTTKLSKQKKNAWELMYQHILTNPSGLARDTNWFHKDYKILVMFRKSIEESQNEDGSKSIIPIPSDNFMDEAKLRPKHVMKMEDFYDKRSGKDFHVVSASHVALSDIVLTVAKLQNPNEYIKLDKSKYRFGRLGDIPHLTIFTEYLSTILRFTRGMNQEDRDKLNNSLKLPRVAGWTISCDIKSHWQYDFRIYSPVLLLVDKRTENGERISEEALKHAPSPIPLFDKNSPGVKPEELDSIWVFGSDKWSSVTTVPQFKYFENASKFMVHINSLKSISGLFKNVRGRQKYYNSGKKEIKSQSNLHDNAVYQTQLLIQGKEEGDKTFLVSRQDAPHIGRLALEDGKPFCDHEIPIQYYKQWVIKSDENIKRVCPLCPKV